MLLEAKSIEGKAVAQSACAYCRLPAEDRTIPLKTIAQRTKLSVDGVEFLLMKTLSLHLVEGVIDQVDSTVQVQLFKRQDLWVVSQTECLAEASKDAAAAPDGGNHQAVISQAQTTWSYAHCWIDAPFQKSSKTALSRFQREADFVLML